MSSQARVGRTTLGDSLTFSRFTVHRAPRTHTKPAHGACISMTNMPRFELSHTVWESKLGPTV